MMKKILCAGMIIALISSASPAAWAVGSGGFENASYSAKQLALGAAVTATPDEPAAISYNPAGITDIPGVQFQADANFISLMTFKANNVTGDTRSSGTLNFIPTSYFTVNPGPLFDNRVAFGLGVDSPFGLSDKYNSNDPAVHYTGWRNWLKMYTLKPVIAVKPLPWLSVGAGPMFYRIYDYGAIHAYPNSLILGAGAADGQLRLETSGSQWGWHIGVLAKIREKHRLGFYFRSPVVVNVHGKAKVENSAFGNRFETESSTKISLPMNMTWAYAFQQSPKTHYEVDFGYTRWATYKRAYIVTDPVANAFDQIIIDTIRSADKDWGNSFGLHLGASHKLTKKLTLRGGSWFYWTPIPQYHFIPAVADSNHMAVSIGAGYDINKYLTADLCYYNSFYFRRRINNDIGENAALVNSSVDGTYTSYSQAFTVSLTMKWDDLFTKNHKKKTEKEGPSIEIKPAH